MSDAHLVQIEGGKEVSLAPDNPADPSLLTGNCHLSSPSTPWLLAGIKDADVRHCAARRHGLAEVAYDFQKAAQACEGCGTCSWRCDLFADDVVAGDIAKAGLAMLGAIGAEKDLAQGIRDYVAADGDLKKFVLGCFLCGRCTITCNQHVNIIDVMVGWRRLLAYAGFFADRNYRLHYTDQEWNVFTVYRYLNGIDFSDLPQLEDAASGQADTLFFPGCNLLNSSPALVRKVGDWLTQQNISYVMSTACCGLTMRSSGRTERARNLKFELRDQMRVAGIDRIITACPACDLAFQETYGEEFEIVPLPQLFVDRGMKVKMNANTLSKAPYTFLDSCIDRKGRFGKPLRQLFKGLPCEEGPESGQDAFCCGAGGSVCQQNPEAYMRNARARLDIAESTGASAAVCSCITCNYTYADMLRRLSDEEAASVPHNLNYLELLFDEYVQWDAIFPRIEDMWMGEKSGWVQQQLL